MGKRDRSPRRAVDMTALQRQVYGALVEFTFEFIDVRMCIYIYIHIHVDIQIHTYSCNSTIIPELPMNCEIVLLSENISFQCSTFDHLIKTRNIAL